MEIKIKLLICIVAICFSCENKTKKKASIDQLSKLNIEDTLSIKMVDTEIIPKIEDSQILDFTIETSMNKINLLDGKSLLSIINNPIFKEGGESEFPELIILNANNTQKLTLLFYPGSNKHQVSYFILESINGVVPKGENVFKVSEAKFKTNNGITLGIKKEVIENKYLLGDLKLMQEDKLLSFILDDYDNPFLKEYNMPIYSAKYFLTNDNVINRIEFGFEYP